jgi:hypothetical protein
MNRRKKKKRSFWSSRIDCITWSAVNKFLFRLRTRQFKYDVRSSVNRYWGSCSAVSVTGIVLLSMNKKNNLQNNLSISYVVPWPSRSELSQVYWSKSAQSELTSLHECWLVLYVISNKRIQKKRKQIFITIELVILI